MKPTRKARRGGISPCQTDRQAVKNVTRAIILRKIVLNKDLRPSVHLRPWYWQVAGGGHFSLSHQDHALWEINLSSLISIPASDRHLVACRCRVAGWCCFYYAWWRFSQSLRHCGVDEWYLAISVVVSLGWVPVVCVDPQGLCPSRDQSSWSPAMLFHGSTVSEISTSILRSR